MGRAKLDMKLIRKEKSRHATFKKRKEGLLRKVREFAILCDVRTCMIIHPPKQENYPAEAEIWPGNADEVSRIINIYRGNSVVSGGQNYALPDFYHARKKRIQEELEKKRKKRLEMAYRPTWIDSMFFLPDTQLRDFATTLGNKVGYVRGKIESIKGSDRYPIQNMIAVLDGPLSQQQQQMMNDCNNNSTRFPAALMQRNIEWGVSAPVNPNEMHVPMFHHQAITDQDLHHHHHHLHPQMHSESSSSMMGLLMDENDHYHGAASSCNFHYAPFKHGNSNFYGPPVGVIENAGVYVHPTPLPHYLVPTALQPPPMGTYMQYPIISDIYVQPHLQSLREKEYEDHFHYSTRDDKGRN